MATARVKVSQELVEHLGGWDGFRALPWPDGTEIGQPEIAEAGWYVAPITNDAIEGEGEEIHPIFEREEDGPSFVAWDA